MANDADIDLTNDSEEEGRALWYEGKCPACKSDRGSVVLLSGCLAYLSHPVIATMLLASLIAQVSMRSIARSASIEFLEKTYGKGEGS